MDGCFGFVLIGNIRANFLYKKHTYPIDMIEIECIIILLLRNMNMQEGIVMSKASVSLLAMVALVFAAIAEKIRATVQAQAPEGYQDASGFHFGSKGAKD